MDLDLIREIRHFGSFIDVLYVEDDQNVQKQMLKMFLKLFNSVDVASNGLEALEMYHEKNYDLVITDIKMPNMCGVELCKNIITFNNEQTILLTSAYKDSNELIRLMDFGVAGFILKPIDMDKLLIKLHNISKKIYAQKMMKLHYDDMKKALSKGASFIEDELYNKDALTSLYNYKYFIETIRDSLKEEYAMLIHIDDFKLINNYYSFAHGNHLLFQVSNVLRQKASEYGCELFRISEDTFVFLKKEKPQTIEILIEETKDILNTLEAQKYNIIGSTGVGISVTGAIAHSQYRLIESLHQALNYAIKNRLKYATFKDIPDHTLDMKNILEIKKLLQESIKNDLLVPLYQQIAMKDGNKKHEVLMRIKDINDETNLISPAIFLDIAKKYGYYNEISKKLIVKALDEIEHEEGIFSINISYQDMTNEEFLSILQENIISKNIGDRLIFEIVESENLDDVEVVKSFINRFREFGVKIAIDDFGSGYSNFAHIFSLMPDFIKIDGTLIKEITQNKRMFVLVETIIEFAHRLNVEVIAEFVSSKELYDILMDLGVDGMQGYYIAQPNYLN